MWLTNFNFRYLFNIFVILRYYYAVKKLLWPYFTSSAVNMSLLEANDKLKILTRGHSNAMFIWMEKKKADN